MQADLGGIEMLGRVVVRGLTLAGVLAFTGAAVAAAQVPFATLGPGAGPLTVFAGNDLSCQVAYQGDASFEMYPTSQRPADCGTFLATGGTLFHFTTTGRGSTAAGMSGTPFTLVSQTPPTGSGSAGSPFRVVTEVTAGATGLRLRQTDSYVSGDESYRTDVQVINESGSPQTLILYRAGDCYLQGNDSGFGFQDPGRSSAGCSVNANNQPAGRIEQWLPITPGANYMQDAFSAVWTRIKAQQPFPNTCQCTTRIDQGAGISWSATIPPGGNQTFSHYTTFSPRGVTGPPASANPPSGNPNNTVTPGQVFQLPSNRRCVSRRAFPIRLRRPRGVTFVAARVSVNGRPTPVFIRRQRVLRITRRYLSGRYVIRNVFRAYVDLRGFPRGTFRVSIRAVTETTRTLTGVRRYRTCSRRLRGGIPRI